MPKIKINESVLYMGVDPRKAGGIAVVTVDRESWSYDMPESDRDIWSIFKTVSQERKVFAYIEKVHSMPQQGVASTFTFGTSFGKLLMALTAAEISYELVTPRSWQKALEIPARKKTEQPGQFKKRLKNTAECLFPQESVTLKTADALLIAEFCRRKENGKCV